MLISIPSSGEKWNQIEGVGFTVYLLYVCTESYMHPLVDKVNYEMYMEKT